MGQPDEGQHLSTGEVARRLGLSRHAVHRLVRAAALVPAHRTPGGYLRFAPASVDAYARLAARASAATGATTDAPLRRVYEALGGGVVVLDPQGRVVEANAAAEEILGVRRSALQGPALSTSVAHVTRPDGSPFPVEERPATVALRTGRPVRGVVVRLRSPDGEGHDRIAQVDAVPLLDAAGSVEHVVVSYTDLTARARAEEGRTHLAAIVAASDDAIVGKTLAGTITTWNGGAERLYGYTAAEMVGQSAARLIPPDQPGELADLLRAVARGETIRRHETTRVRRDGARIAVAVTIAPMRDHAGAVVGASVVARDIGARLAVEEALRASEGRYRALSEHASDLVTILDRAGIYRYVSPSYEHILGYAPAALEGRGAFDFAHPDDAAALAAVAAALAAAPETAIRAEGRARHADGSWRVIETTYYNRLGDPAIRGIVANSHDVTVRARMQRDLEEGQQRYRSLFDHHPDAVFALGLDGALTSANAACTALCGYTVEELLALSFPALIAPEDLERGAGHFARAVAGEPQHDVALGLRRKDGDGRAVSVTAIPIVVDGAVVGVYGIAKDVTAHNAAQRALRHQATHDALTDLPNRARLRDRLAQAWATGAPPALLLLDLDGFKEVNDTFGHDQGDALLREVARRLHGAVRGSDTVARLGGDEFAVALPGADVAGAERVASALRAALDAPFQIEGLVFQLGASVGIAPASADDDAPDTLLRRADVAMYAAKRGRLGQQVYDPALDTYSPERLALIAELRAAIAGGALALHYQPQADLASGRVRGVEALARWPHPDLGRGLIPPDRFIPLAEQTGPIGPLTAWVLGEAIRQCGVWRHAGLALTVSVNLSAWNLHDPALPEHIAALLRAHVVPATSLRLEVTETTLMADPERALAVLTRLSALGVALAVDDFGAGYSSLAYLKTLPVNELKIDKGFVRELATDATDAAIVASTVALGHALGLRVVAEGIEDRASWELLTGMGCDVAQGYYLSRPLPPDALICWLREAPWAVA